MEWALNSAQLGSIMSKHQTYICGKHGYILRTFGKRQATWPGCVLSKWQEMHQKRGRSKEVDTFRGGRS